MDASGLAEKTLEAIEAAAPRRCRVRFPDDQRRDRDRDRDRDQPYSDTFVTTTSFDKDDRRSSLIRETLRI